jgi:hypothetical protein
MYGSISWHASQNAGRCRTLGVAPCVGIIVILDHWSRSDKNSGAGAEGPLLAIRSAEYKNTSLVSESSRGEIATFGQRNAKMSRPWTESDRVVTDPQDDMPGHIAASELRLQSGGEPVFLSMRNRVRVWSPDWQHRPPRAARRGFPDFPQYCLMTNGYASSSGALTNSVGASFGQAKLTNGVSEHDANRRRAGSAWQGGELFGHASPGWFRFAGGHSIRRPAGLAGDRMAHFWPSVRRSRSAEHGGNLMCL